MATVNLNLAEFAKTFLLL